VIDIEGMEVAGHGADVKISNCCNERRLTFHCGWLCISRSLNLLAIVW
jgi:hypothetical protein